MTAARRKRIAWGLRGVALAALLAYAAGRYASRSGGLVVVEQWFDHPVLLVGSAVVLIVVSLIIEFEFCTEVSPVGCAVGVVALILGSPLIAPFVIMAGDGRIERQAAPGRTDRVLTLTDVSGFSIDPVYRVELVSGSGWSARHWSMGTWNTRGGYIERADWSGPDRITITGRTKLTVFDVLPDGSLSAPREEALPPKH
ncbi:hypothetical protein ACIRRH_18885 [Kitasatospora sp. NPDC101235]|uniref:hypothetical protein n=1 Tax=Kitasatospora sp. NPDC101235 TaxID=3364101 RepID=UPI0038082CBF